jgi:glycerophosphoryl diester phosphodiesterase
MGYLKNSFVNAWDFLKGSAAYFRDVLLMHGFMLFIFLPLLASTTRIILKSGGISYLSYDNLGTIIHEHLGVFLALCLVLALIVVASFFEFTFLLLSVFFIIKKQPISLPQLIRGTFLQLKKVRLVTFLFFLCYFFFILPISGLSFQSDLLAKVKIPAFILDFIFANRVMIVTSFVLMELIVLYLAIRLIFALPEMILRDSGFRAALKKSWQLTKRRSLQIFGQFVFVGGATLLITGLGYVIVIVSQMVVEHFWPVAAFPSAVIAMTLLQFFLLLNLVLSTVGIFYVIIDDMRDINNLPELPQWYQPQKITTVRWSRLKMIGFSFIVSLFGWGVIAYNTNYLGHTSLKAPITISHRGVNNGNQVQNSLEALMATSQLKPKYVEMDIQETKDHQFVVMHDFNLKELAGINKRPNQLTLKELTKLTIEENGAKVKIASFDDYLATAQQLNQKLLIEIKTTPQDSLDLTERFIKKYRTIILQEQHILHTLTYKTAVELKEKEPSFYVGYIIPFNVVGSPDVPVDFFTIEYSTLNRNFVNAAHNDGKKVFTWTVNDEDTITRQLFYGVDGIITDDLTLLNETIKNDLDTPTYSDKLLNFTVGFG